MASRGAASLPPLPPGHHNATIPMATHRTGPAYSAEARRRRATDVVNHESPRQLRRPRLATASPLPTRPIEGGLIPGRRRGPGRAARQVEQIDRFGEQAGVPVQTATPPIPGQFGHQNRSRSRPGCPCSPRLIGVPQGRPAPVHPDVPVRPGIARRHVVGGALLAPSSRCTADLRLDLVPGHRVSPLHTGWTDRCHRHARHRRQDKGPRQRRYRRPDPSTAPSHGADHRDPRGMLQHLSRLRALTELDPGSSPQTAVQISLLCASEPRVANIAAAARIEASLRLLGCGSATFGDRLASDHHSWP